MKYLKIKAITVCDGNVPLAQGIKNCQTILSLVDSPSTLIYAGMDGPIVRNLHEVSSWSGHGIDGLGNVTIQGGKHYELHLKGTNTIPIQAEHAAIALSRLVREAKGELTVVAIGPLSNIAMAIRLDPNFIENVKEIVIMGGSLLAKGNSSRSGSLIS